MVSERPNLRVVGKEPVKADAFPAKSEEVFPQLATNDSFMDVTNDFEQRLAEYRLEVLKLAHQRELQEAHLQMAEIKLRTTFELLLQEALVNGVPYAYIQGAHSQADEALEELSQKVG
jgi:hypothetical protein